MAIKSIRILAKAIVAGIESAHIKPDQAIEKLVEDLMDYASSLDMDAEEDDGLGDCYKKNIALSQVEMITMFADLIEDTKGI